MSQPPIPLGRRIGEIIEAKGPAFSGRALSKRIGIGKDILYRVINGDRYISPSELELVATGLRMSVQRIKQEDTRKEEEELRRLLQNLEDLERALLIAENLVSVALGISERCTMLNYLGSVYYELKNYELAHKHWMQAYSLALEINNRYGDTDRLYHVLTNLMLSFSVKKDYEQAVHILQHAKPILEKDNGGLGALYYTLACIAYDKGDHTAARPNFYLELHCHLKTNHRKAIGKSEHNVAYIEYKLGNFETADLYFQRAIRSLSKFDEGRLIAMKDYVKVLVRMGNLQKAEQLTLDALQEIKSIIWSKGRLTNLQAKFLILQAIISDETSSAEKVLHMNVDAQFKYFALKFLMSFYSRQSDEIQLIKYYKMAESLMDEPAIYDEEGF